MEISVELIVCTKDKKWDTHYEFIEEEELSIAEEVAVSKFLNRIQDEDLVNYYNNVIYVGVFSSKEVKV